MSAPGVRRRRSKTPACTGRRFKSVGAQVQKFCETDLPKFVYEKLIKPLEMQAPPPPPPPPPEMVTPLPSTQSYTTSEDGGAQSCTTSEPTGDPAATTAAATTRRRCTKTETTPGPI